MSEPEQRNPTYGLPPAAAYDQPWGPPAPAPPFAAPYGAPTPAPGAFAEPAAVPGGPALGIVALVAGLLALVVSPALAAIASYPVGIGVGREVALRPSAASFDWAMLSPVRDWVLLGEISFWAGTVLGVWALVQGIVAIAKKRGRGAGIAAVVVAVLGPISFGVAVTAFAFAGIAAGSSIGG